MSDVQDKASFIWSAAGKPRNDYKPYEYQKEILIPLHHQTHELRAGLDQRESTQGV